MATTFDKARRTVPATIGTVQFTVKDRLASVSSALPDPGGLTVNFQIQVLDANGQTVDTIQGDLWPKLTTAQQNGITALVSAMRIKALEVI